MKYSFLLILLIANFCFAPVARSQSFITFDFSSDEDNRLLKDTDSLKYYVASGDTTNVVCLDEEASYYKLLNKDRKLIAEGAYVMDGDKYLQQGKWTEHYISGKVKLTGYYTRGKQLGTWQEYSSTGKLKTVSNYAVIDDKGFRSSCLSGTYQEYYPNGKLKLNGLYVAVSVSKKDTIEVDDPVSGEKKIVVSTHDTYSAEKTGQWEHYDENGELEKKEEL